MQDIIYSRSNVIVPFPAPIHLQLARVFHELVSRDRGEGRATEQSQGIGSEAYLNNTSQGPIPEDARKDVNIRGRSHAKA
jgi:hypothetical protein